MNKLVKIIDTMDKEDLMKIKLDLEEGNMRRLIERRLSMMSNDNKVCPVCSKPASWKDYVLEFGKSGMRMKASFDALDCLQHFVRNLEKKSSEPSDA